MEKSKIRIGVMGCASIAQRLVIPAIQLLPDQFELVAIASRTSEKAASFAHLFSTEAVTGYQNLVDRDDIDAIYMPLPTGQHEEWITKSLQGGKHVLVEKSFAMDNDSAQRMVKQANASGLLLMENFMFRYHSQHQLVWQLLKEEKLGELRLFRSQFGFPPLDKNNFRYKKEEGGGALLDAGAYTVKAAQWFLGQELEVAAATLYIDEQSGVDIYGNASLINKNGLVAQLSFGFDNYYQCNYEFWGSQGKLIADRAFTPKPMEQPRIIWEVQGDRKEVFREADNHFKNLLSAFYEAIIEEKHQPHLQELLVQSKLLSDINKLATKVKI